MNRKGARGQNDISIITGLPKRLQRKIAEEIADDGLKTMELQQQQPKMGDNEVASKAAAPAEFGLEAASATLPIDFFMRKSPGHGAQQLELSAAAATVQHEPVAAELEPKVAESIPGILRLNAAEVSILSKTPVLGRRNVNVSRENGRRARPQRSEVALRAELPMSPQRHAIGGNGAIVATSFPLWFDVLDAPYAKELSPLYESLTQMMQRHVVLENWKKFCSIRTQLQHIFTQLLLQQLKFCCEQKVDTFFWKLLFYNVREYLKTPQSEKTSDRIIELIDSGLQFYTDLHAELCSKYLKDAAGRVVTTHKFSFIAKVAAQKLLICLGDLSRYKVLHLQTQDYIESANYYQQAQYLIPSNGIPYNQLAVVAIHARRKFDAIYFHMRSLMSSNAIYSARESLLVLFDEIRKKYEETEFKASPVHQLYNGNNSKSMRKEVWIHPDGVRRLHRTDLNGANKFTLSEENRFDEMTAEELLRRFTSLFLYVIGKLYTGIGMESIQEHQRKFLLHLNVVLKRNIFTRTRLLKMIALNIFVMEQNVHKDKRREIRYQAFNFCNQMFGLILRKSNQLLTLAADDANALLDNLTDLNTLLQFIKIYTDWLAQNPIVWEPVRSEEHAYINCWAELELLFGLLQRIQTHITKEQPHPGKVITLDEDNYLVGFTPLAATLAKHYEPQRADATELLQFKIRSTKIANFQQCYEDNRKRLVVPDESHFILEELNTVIKTALDNLKVADYDNENNSENIVVNGDGDGDDDDAELCKSKSTTELKLTNSENLEDAHAQLTQLTKLKKELEEKTNVKKMYNAKLEQILKFVDTKVYIEVRPKYLLPDTNCFIDCLEDFQRLSREFKRYTLVIPLIVVKELDGLSKGVKMESYEKSLQKHRIHHFDDVSTCAKKSLDFIKTAKNNVKCATTKGSIINASLFALVEEEHVSNDDKILATALALSKTMSTETSSDGKCFIQTELVLITTDRNLRVKALSRNLAVSELSEFVQWAKDCNI